MSETEVLDKIEKLTDDQFYAVAKEVSGFSFVSASAKAILHDIIKEKEPEAIVETPAEAIIEQEVAAPVIEETPEIIPTVEEKTETPAEEVAPAIEEKIEGPVASIVEETPTEPIEETVTETPAIEEIPVEPAVEVTETPVVAEVVAEPIRLPEHEKVAGHEKQIANLNTLLEIEDDDDAKGAIQKKIKFYQLMLNNAKKELEAALASQTLSNTDRPVFKEKLEEANRIMENVKLPQELAAPVVTNGNTKDARLVVNMFMGLQNPAVEDEETQAENEASCKKHYNKLTAEEKAFVDQKLNDYNVTINPKEELKDGGNIR